MQRKRECRVRSCLVAPWPAMKSQGSSQPGQWPTTMRSVFAGICMPGGSCVVLRCVAASSCLSTAATWAHTTQAIAFFPRKNVAGVFAA